MKLGIVGAGLIVHTLLEFVDDLKEVDKVAICSLPGDLTVMEELAKEHNIKKIYTDYDAFLADEEVEVVYLGVSNHVHYQMGKKALQARKNVIMEKPFCSNYQQALKLKKLAEENDLIIVEAITNQFNANYLKMKELLPTIGDVKIVNLNYTQYSSRYDAFKAGKILPAFDVNKSGGALMDLNVYNIHVATGLFGRPEKVEYYPNMEKNIDTSGVLLMRYPHFTVISIGAKDCDSPLLNCIQGNKGSLYTTSPLFTFTDLSYKLNKQPAMHYNLVGSVHRMRPEFERFTRIMDEHDKKTAAEMLEHTMIVMEVLTEARKSAGIVFPDDQNL